MDKRLDAAQAQRLSNGVAARSTVEAAHGAIRQDILDGTLAPGTKLRFEMLRERYRVGASTLREALTRLVGEGLVTSEEQRGFRVAPVSLEDFADLTAMRKMLEVEAMRQSIRLGDDVWEAALVAAFHRLSRVEEKLGDYPERHREEWENRNREFHLALIAACPSRWLKHMHAILYQQAERYRRITLGNPVVPRDIHAEHKALHDAALERDVELACLLGARHIDRTVAVLNRVLTAEAASPDRASPGRNVAAS
jgi:GntR family carbon starvation induced transcriptional regulator